MTVAPPQPPENLPLASLFEPAERRDWQQLVAAVLRKSGKLGEGEADAAAEAALSTITYDGVPVLPLYTRDDAAGVEASGVPGRAPFVRGARAGGAVPTGWDVRARHAGPDPQRAREAVMADLENGVSSLWLILGPGGLPPGSLDAVLRDVYLDLAPIVIDAGPDTEEAAAEFLTVIGRRDVLPQEVRGNLGADPIGLRARFGGRPPDLGPAIRLARRVLDGFPGLRAITVDATAYHDAGGSDAQELGASLATGVAYLRALTEAGLSLAEAFGQLEFRYAADADQFLTIAKFRAGRRLWARVAEVCGLDGAGADGDDPAAAGGQVQHAVTSSAMMTRRDPWVNLLRTTLACFGAGVGGAQAVTVQPFDAALGRPDDFSRRIARNTSSLLVMESHLARVIDPAGGSWYVERLTADLAEAAWDCFTELERAGGIAAALESGLMAERLQTTWKVRAENLSHRRDALTGVSEFPNLAEKLLVRTAFPLAVPIGPGALPRRRYAEDFESLRDAADADAEQRGRRASVFLATIGSAAASTARASFAANLFQAGGLATETSGAGTDPAAIAAAFRVSRAGIACLASSDKVYAEHAAAVAAALKEAGVQYLWLAGSPGQRAEQDAAAGIDGYLSTGVDALAVLRAAHRLNGITVSD